MARDYIAYRYWSRVRNIGDELMPFVLAAAFNARGLSVSGREPHLLGIGSTLSLAMESSHVWGTGLLHQWAEIPDLHTKQLYALRGKLTADRLVKAGIKVPELPLGDPAVFASEILTSTVPARTLWGAWR